MRAGIIVHRDSEGLADARRRYEIAVGESAPKIKTDEIENYLFKKAMQHFCPEWSEEDDRRTEAYCPQNEGL